jgi:hypothetical protein
LLSIEPYRYFFWQQRKLTTSVSKSIHCTFKHSCLLCHQPSLNQKSISFQSLVTSLW